ncbi:MAG: class I SAM-dependent methyltransferase [Planctomycetes bacterium]|nr:class I SAM-dependent methyltransferase [Planctomycetota bacterium]
MSNDSAGRRDGSLAAEELHATVSRRDESREIDCPACGGAGHGEVTLRWGIRIVRCGCGLVFANPQPSEQALAAYYGPEYFQRNSEKFLDRPMRRDVRLRFERYLSAVRQYSTGKRVLDAGCGTGMFLTLCREAGLEVKGVELSDYAARIGREELGLDIHTGMLEELGDSRLFDAVTMWDFLEHTRDPLAVLRSARALIPDSGHVFLTVPNVGSWWARGMGANWIGFDKASEHLFYFTSHSLRLLLERAGFEPLSIRPHAWVCTAEFLFSRGKKAWPRASGLFDATTRMLRLRERVIRFPSANLLAVARKSR